VLQEQLKQKIDGKTKPLGALGILEDIALQVGLIQGTVSPEIHNPHIIVFAADHGISATGLITPYPQEVTAQMVLNFLQGGAAINVFTRQHHTGLTVVDAGVNFDFAPELYGPRFINHKINYGTKNYLEEEAMTRQEALSAIEKGKNLIRTFSAEGCNTVGFGEMGIGNTSAASLLMSAVTGFPIEDCTGRGTGLNDEQLRIKIATLKKVFEKHRLDQFSEDPIGLLIKTGGFEITMMAGAYLQAAQNKMIILVDGFITTAALLIAYLFDKTIISNCIFAHASGENGHEKMLHFLQARPLLHLGLRLGEGTGAALALPLIQSAVNFLNEMASFETAGVSEKTTGNTEDSGIHSDAESDSIKN
jgi:nicotinate-nucleotide--dimethylbenzimidazole phosphoribosyltransferase